MNQIDKIRNGQTYLIKDIYQNTIFSKLDRHYTLNDQIRFTVKILKDLRIKYLIKTGKVYVFGGKIKKKKNKKKKGGGLELVMISGIIIGAIWSLIQIYEKLDDWMKKRNGNSKSSPFKKRNPEEYINPSSESSRAPIPSAEIPRQSPERPRQSPERPRPTSEMMRISIEDNKRQKKPSSSRKKNKTPLKKNSGIIKRLFRKFPIL